MTKIKFVRASLIKTKHPTTFLNKTRKKSINNALEDDNYTLNIKETPVDCITAEKDFNYFLAKGCRNSIKVPNCQSGFPFSSLFSEFSNFKCNGNVSYTNKAGKFFRSELTLYGLYKPDYPLSSTRYSFPSLFQTNLIVSTVYAF